MTRSSIFFASILSVLGACGGSSSNSTPDCEGICGTFLVSVSIIDTTGAASSCAAGGVAKIELAFTSDTVDPFTQTYACTSDAHAVGPVPAGTYRLTARTLSADGAANGKVLAAAAIVGDKQMEPINLRIVPGPVSLLGAACGESTPCPSGYACVGLALAGGGSTFFCTQTCGTSPKETAPPNGDLVCQSGYGNVGEPSCMLYGEGMGDVSWSCAILCEDMKCPEGMRCESGSGMQPTCVR